MAMVEEKHEVFTERRGEIRLPVGIRFKYKLSGASGVSDSVHTAVTKNVSAAGLLFESEEQIPVDAELGLVLTMFGVPPLLFAVEGKVAALERLSASTFNIGVNFIKISDADRAEFKRRIERVNIVNLLGRSNKKGISDLHLTANLPPMIRAQGTIKPLDNEPLSAEEIKQMIYSILSDDQKLRVQEEKDLDLTFAPSADSRYRISVYHQRGNIEAVFRHIMPNIKSTEELGLPDVVKDICELKDGLVIIGGTTGSGKTTTIATMIDIISRKRNGVVLSLEKPIEHIHVNTKGVVKQREVGVDIASFASGLTAALRQDPDVIVVGEVLDFDTIKATLQAVETGHLVITSLHATDTVQVFDRLISFFPLDQRNFIYARLSHSLKAIIIQSLLPHKDGTGRVVATEVCTVTPAVRRMIYTGEFTQLPSIMQTSSQYKMHLMQYSIDELLARNLISAETAETYSKK